MKGPACESAIKQRQRRARRRTLRLLQFVHGQDIVYEEEKRLHDQFKKDHATGEWFKYSDAVQKYITEEINARRQLI